MFVGQIGNVEHGRLLSIHLLPLPLATIGRVNPQLFLFQDVLQLVFGPFVHISAGLWLVFQGLQPAFPGWKHRDFGLVKFFFVDLGRLFHHQVGRATGLIILEYTCVLQSRLDRDTE